MSLIRTQWNVVARLQSGHFATGKWHLNRLGAIPGETADRRCLVATVPDIDQWLARLLDKWQVGWAIFEDFQYIRPVRSKLAFDSETEFLTHASGMALEYASKLAGREVAVHVESRGYDGDAIEERTRERICETLERQLDISPRKSADAAGGCEVLVDIEIVEQTAGMGIWTAEQCDKYPFLGFSSQSTRPRPRHRPSLRI